ncbi:MAG: glutamate-cysteine ligase family protein [Planctomycetota bacterium]
MDLTARIGVDAALERIAERSLPTDGSHPERLAVGLEPERFAVEFDAAGYPLRRLPLDGADGVLAAIDRRTQAIGPAGTFAPRDPERMPPFVGLARGGSLTFEPGAQIEHSTAVHPNGSAALDDVRQVVGELEATFADRRVALVSLGLDPWNTPADVPQQLEAGRYRSMAAFFDAVGPSGPWMMRLSCSLQVNLDLGRGRDREERWLLSNLLSPILVASFSTSPELRGDPRFHCRRARVWQTIDPTRTGFPAGLLSGSSDDPALDYARAVLDADVMLYRKGDDAVPGTPGFRFRDWIQDGHPEHGYPTVADLDYHLTTAFFEVRARGFLELRGIDALPYCWRPAAVAFVAGLLYDAQARGLALERLESRRSELDARWRETAERGFETPQMREDAEFLWPLALEGAERLGPDFLRTEHLNEARGFAARFPLAGRAPADELREARAEGPCAELRWAVGTGCNALA